MTAQVAVVNELTAVLMRFYHSIQSFS